MSKPVKTDPYALRRRLEAPELKQKWEIFDSRTGHKVTVTTYPSREWARWQIQSWRELGVGNRIDLKKALHFLDTRPQRVIK